MKRRTSIATADLSPHAQTPGEASGAPVALARGWGRPRNEEKKALPNISHYEKLSL